MNKVFLSTLIISLVLGSFAVFPGTKALSIDFPSVNQEQQSSVQTTDQSSLQQTQTSNIKDKTPAPKSEGHIVLGKFFITMLWVVGSCGALFLILLLYKKKFGGLNMTDGRPMSKEQDLTSPTTVDEAVKLFIEKF